MDGNQIYQLLEGEPALTARLRRIPQCAGLVHRSRAFDDYATGRQYKSGPWPLFRQMPAEVVMPEDVLGQESSPIRLAVSPEQAAVALGIGRTTVYDLISRGQLRSLRVGRRRIIPVAALETFLAEASGTDPDAA